MPLWLPLALRVFGFYVNEPGWSVAEDAVKKNDVSICQKILFMPWEIYSPSTKDQRWECIYRFAKNTKDPTACELLMPSSYGMSCVGAAVSASSCFFGTNGQVKGGGLVTTIDECLRGPLHIQTSSCCTVALANSVVHCESLFSEKQLYNECLYRAALRKHDISICKSITNENLQSGCKISTTALQQDPSICTSCHSVR